MSVDSARSCEQKTSHLLATDALYMPMTAAAVHLLLLLPLTTANTQQHRHLRPQPLAVCHGLVCLRHTSSPLAAALPLRHWCSRRAGHLCRGMPPAGAGLHVLQHLGDDGWQCEHSTLLPEDQPCLL